MSDFKKRQFSHPTGFGERIDELADEHYNRNVSRLIRCAIADHEKTLDGEDEFSVQALESKLEEIAENIENLQQSEHKNLDTEDASPACTKSNSGSDLVAVQRSVQQCLLDEGPLRLDAILQQVDGEDSLTARDAIEALLDKDYIAKQSTEEGYIYEISH